MGFDDYLTTATVAAEAPTPIVRGLTTTAYGRKALDDELGVLAATPEGGRNDQLNRSAFNIAQLVNAGHVEVDEARTALEHTARMIGLSTAEIGATIRSAGNGAGTKPRLVVPAPDAPTPVRPATVIAADTEPEDGVDAFIDQTFPTIDWHELWAREDDDLDWIVEPLLPARRLIAMYSLPKVGKSILMLELAAAIASGRKVLGVQPKQGRVLYVDFENDPVQDTRTRLQQMGYQPGDLDDLRMLSFPTLAALDSSQGAQELLAVAARHRVDTVIVDTVSRAVRGEENDNDTWLAFYRHTGLHLKRAGIALMRLDHAGKDVTKGQRGGSAKVGDVDAVWRLDRIADHPNGEVTLRLECEAQRFPFPETALTLTRRRWPLLHEVAADSGRAVWNAKVAECMAALDAAKAPHDAGRDIARRLLKGHGFKVSNDVLSAALKARGGIILEDEPA